MELRDRRISFQKLLKSSAFLKRGVIKILYDQKTTFLMRNFVLHSQYYFVICFTFIVLWYQYVDSRTGYREHLILQNTHIKDVSVINHKMVGFKSL